MKKIVIKLSSVDEKSKRKALKAVADLEGVESVAVDMKEKKITLIGEADPVNVASKLRRKFGYAEMLSVGPAKEEKKEAPPKQEPKKKKEAPPKQEPKKKKEATPKQEPKKEEKKQNPGPKPDHPPNPLRLLFHFRGWIATA